LEALSVFLEGCDTVVVPQGGGAQTQLSGAQLAALAAAGEHPGSSGAGPTAQPGATGTPSGGDTAPTTLTALLKDADFIMQCKALGISENARAMAQFAQQLIDDRVGITPSVRIEQLSAAR